MNWTPKRLFQGRLKRTHFLIGNIVANSVLGSFLIYYFAEMRFDLYRVFWLLFAVCFFGLFSLIIRRLHDMGRSWSWSLLFLLPILNFIFTLFLCVFPGDKKENKYGKLENRGLIKSILNIKK